MNREVKERKKLWRGETKQKEVGVVLKRICAFCDTPSTEGLRRCRSAGSAFSISCWSFAVSLWWLLFILPVEVARLVFLMHNSDRTILWLKHSLSPVISWTQQGWCPVSLTLLTSTAPTQRLRSFSTWVLSFLSSRLSSCCALRAQRRYSGPLLFLPKS